MLTCFELLQYGEMKEIYDNAKGDDDLKRYKDSSMMAAVHKNAMAIVKAKRERAQAKYEAEKKARESKCDS